MATSFSRANTIELVGACVIAEGITRDIMLSDKILRLTFAHEVNPEWVLWSLRSKNGRSEIERLATGNQQSMRNIGQDRIREIRIPLPPRATQDRLVALIKETDEPVRTRIAALQGVTELIENVRGAILAKAFCGELVPIEAELARREGRSYEPASVLLERIRAERASAAAAPKRRRQAATSASPGARSPQR